VSANDVQLLVALANGGIVPVHVTETVWPTVEGTVILLVAGLDASAVRSSEDRATNATTATAATQANPTKPIFVRR
jgi:hypothetical protein